MVDERTGALPVIDQDAIEMLADLHAALVTDHTSAVLASVAMGLDAMKSFMLMGASINKVIAASEESAEFVDGHVRT